MEVLDLCCLRGMHNALYCGCQALMSSCKQRNAVAVLLNLCGSLHAAPAGQCLLSWVTLRLLFAVALKCTFIQAQ
jgi:hypothetical protein